MKRRFALVLFLLASVVSAETKIRLFLQASPMPSGAVGDIYYTSAVSGLTGTIAPLHIGTSGQCLVVSSGLPHWSSSCGGGGSSPLTTKGDLWGFDSADNRVPIGSNGQFLEANSGSALGLRWHTLATGDLPFTYTGSTTALATSTGSLVSGDCASWDASGNIIDAGAACGGGSSSPLTTKGDIWGFSSADARIPIGADWKVLTADATQTLGLRWATLVDSGSSGTLPYFDGTKLIDSAFTYSLGSNYGAINPSPTFGTPHFRFINNGGHYLDLSTNSSTNLSLVFPPADGSSGDCLHTDGSGNLSFSSCLTGGGTVTSVAITGPSIFSWSGTPITSSGTLTGTLASQSANLGLWSPNGSSGTPTFRAAEPADIDSSTGSNGNCIVKSGGVWTAGSCGSGSGGTVTSISTTAPATGCSSPCTSTATVGVATMVTAGGSHAGGAVPDPGVTLHSPPYLLGEDAAYHNPISAGAGNFTSATALGSEPGSPNTGDLNFPTNGFGLQRYATTWANSWGPLFPLTFPPLVSPGVTTTLSAAITSTSSTTFTATATGFPATPFLIIIDTEEMKVTNITGTTWTETRGYNSTTAATHLISATVTLENWDWINKNVADSVTQETNQGFDIFATATSLNRRAYKRLIGTSGLGSTTVTVGVIPSMTSATANNSGFGVFLRESSTGKCYAMTLNIITAANQYYVSAFDTTAHFSTSSGTGITTIVGSLMSVAATPIWFKISLAGTTVVASFSNDGQNFTQIASSTKTVIFTTAPDEWGVMVQPDTGDGYSANLNVISFKEQ